MCYHTIETLLPNSGFKETEGRGKLLELWCMPGTKRKGWTSVCFKEGPFIRSSSASVDAPVVDLVNIDYSLSLPEIDEEETSKIPISDEEDEFSDDAFDDPDDFL